MKRKRILAVVLTGLLAVSLAACGSGLSSQEMQNMEKYAKAAGQSFEYSSLNHITDVKVAVPSGEETLAEIIEEKTGKLENIDLSEIEAIVTEKNSDGGELYLVSAEGDAKKHFDSIAAAAAKSDSSSDSQTSSSTSSDAASSDTGRGGCRIGIGECDCFSSANKRYRIGNRQKLQRSQHSGRTSYTFGGTAA